MDQYYYQQQGHQGQHGQQQQQQQGPPGQQYNQHGQHSYPQQHQQNQHQPYGNYSADQAYNYQYQQQYQEYYQQQPYQQPASMPAPSNPASAYTAAVTAGAAALATGSSLPPSYSTPLPPPKNKNNNFQNQKQNPLSKYQAQYQSSMQMGAAAASAAAAALFQYGFPSGATTNTSTPAATTPASAPAGTVMNGVTTVPTTSFNVAQSGGGSGDWFSTYQPPTIEQRMAVTMAQNAGGRPPYGNNNNNNKRNNQRQNPRQGSNQRGGKNQNSNNRQQQNKRAAAAVKEEAAEAAEEIKDAGFHCDACDVTFHEEIKLKTHIAAHRACPDCQYQASPSLVAEHRKLTHGPSSKVEDGNAVSAAATVAASATSTLAASTLLAPSSSAAGTGVGSGKAAPEQNNSNNSKKPKPVNPELLHPLAPTLNTQEDIDNWIAQRRKQWPTESNILKKEQEKQEMIAKGQIVGNSSGKDQNVRDKRNNNNNNRNSNNNNNNNNNSNKRSQHIVESAENVKKLKIEGGDVEMTLADPPTTAPSDGLVPYASSSTDISEDEEMDPVKDAVTSKDPTVMGKVLLPGDRPMRPKRPCKFFLRGTCTKGERCTFLHDPQMQNKVQKSQQQNAKKEVFRTRPSLLQMLLSGEIKEEKNVLLEAIRYIVDSNYFDKQEPSGPLVEEVSPVVQV